MRFSYNKLWKMLIDKNMKKSDLKAIAGISSTSVAKLVDKIMLVIHPKDRTTEVLLRIWEALDCDISDIMEVVKDVPQEVK